MTTTDYAQIASDIDALVAEYVTSGMDEESAETLAVQAITKAADAGRYLVQI